MTMPRDTVLLCHSDNWWSVYLSHGGELEQPIADAPFARAYAAAMELVFGHSWPRDYIQTARQFGSAEDFRVPGFFSEILMPEGGQSFVKDIWTSYSMASSHVGERFHVTNLRDRVEERDIPFLSNRSSVDEIEIRHDWRAIEFSSQIAARQAKEAEPLMAPAEIAAANSAKDSSVRQWGIYSPHYQELYGHLSRAEWDGLWQAWQAETLSDGGLAA